MKIIRTGHEARTSLKRGLDMVADAVKVTLGPSGRNAILGRKFLTPQITNDGVTVAKYVQSDDEIEQLGVEKAREVSQATDDNVQDGTTTATVLLQAIFEEGYKRLVPENSIIKKNKDPIAIKNEIEKACAEAVLELNSLGRVVSTKEEIEQVAFVSVENREIAQKIAEIYDALGQDGVVTIEDGAEEIEIEIVKGVELKIGTPTNMGDEKKELTINKAHLLFTNTTVERVEQVQSIAGKLAEKGFTELVIIAPGFSKEILADFVVSKLKGTFTIVALKPPFWTNKERLEDIALKFGGLFFDAEKGYAIETADIQHLGVAKVVMDKERTLLIGGTGDVSARIVGLKAELKKTKGALEKSKIEERISVLNGGIGIIRVGAKTESVKEYLKMKVIDAVGAAKAALQEGVVHGGGLALKSVAEKLSPTILTEALKAPYNQIQKNVGHELLIGENIVDPLKVTRTALQNACSLAGILLTTEIAIADKNERIKGENSEGN